MPALTETQASPRLAKGRVARSLWLGAGLALIALGVIGIFVPLLPTFDFLILALPCLARSSPRLESWLLNHPRFGPSLRAWKEKRAVPRGGKRAALFGMSLGYGLFVWHVKPSTPLALGIALFMIAALVWIFRRPDPGERMTCEADSDKEA